MEPIFVKMQRFVLICTPSIEAPMGAQNSNKPLGFGQSSKFILLLCEDHLYKLKRGHRADPCGTPHSISTSCPFIDTNCFLLVKPVIRWLEYHNNLTSSTECYGQLYQKLLEVYEHCTRYFIVLRDDLMSWLTNAWIVECLLLNPNCFSYIQPWMLRKLENLSCISFSTISLTKY